MRNIAFVAHLSEVSGSGTALLETSVAFSGMGYKIYLILPGAGALFQRALQRGIQPVIIPNPEVALTEVSLLHKLKVGWARLVYLVQLSRFFRRKKIDLVYINSSANIFPGLAAQMAGRPVAWHIHETISTSDWRAKLKKKIICWISDGIIYASRSSKEALGAPESLPAMIARNYVNIEKLSTLRQLRKPFQKNGNYKIFMSGTVEMKGADLLLQAMQIVIRRHVGIEPYIIIAGPPPREAAFEHHINQLASSPELTGRVKLPGLLDSLASMLASIDLFISPSRSEALPIAIVEAMAAGAPVIATDVGDCAELLDHGRCGWVVPPEDANALADAITEAITSPEAARTKANAASEKITRRYGASDFWQPLRDFVDSLTSR